MPKKNDNYWKKRFEALEDERYQRSTAYYQDVQKQFRQAMLDIQADIERWYWRLADNNDISYAAAKRLLKKNELEEFKWNVDKYIAIGEKNAINQRWMKQLENASARYHISYLETMKLQIQQHTELLYTDFEEGVTDYLHKNYGEQYYHTAHEIAKGTGIGTNLSKLNIRQIDKIIKKPWARDGTNFSDRIWSNKQKLVNNLHTELTQSIVRGTSPKQAIDNLSKTMNVSKSQAGRLIMTESAAVSSAAQKDCFKDLGVERYEVLATLDSLTSEICREMDGKVFKMSDYEVGVTANPFHPNCRSATVPYFDDEFTEGEERAARGQDGKTYYVPANLKYKDWKKQFVDNDLPLPRLSGKKTQYEFTKTRGLEKAIAYRNQDGVEFIYPQKYNKSQQKISPETAMEVFEKVPKIITQNIDAICFVDYQNPQDKYWEKLYGIKDFVSYATGGNRKITFYANKNDTASKVAILETYLHEGGHIFDKEYKKIHGLEVSKTPEYAEAMSLDKKYNGRKYISDYAEESQSISEDFADFIMGYFTDPDYYSIMTPNRIKLIKEILKLW